MKWILKSQPMRMKLAEPARMSPRLVFTRKKHFYKMTKVLCNNNV